jgi:hypothetical protein
VVVAAFAFNVTCVAELTPVIVVFNGAGMLVSVAPLVYECTRVCEPRSVTVVAPEFAAATWITSVLVLWRRYIVPAGMAAASALTAIVVVAPLLDPVVVAESVIPARFTTIVLPMSVAAE